MVAAVLAGRREQFAILVSRYQQRPLLRVAVSRLGRLDWAEESVQETFLAALKSIATYDSRYSFRTWLWTILLNQCRRHYQRRQRQVATVDWQPAVDERVAANVPSPPHAAMASRTDDRFGAAVRVCFPMSRPTRCGCVFLPD